MNFLKIQKDGDAYVCLPVIVYFKAVLPERLLRTTRISIKPKLIEKILMEVKTIEEFPIAVN